MNYSCDLIKVTTEFAQPTTYQLALWLTRFGQLYYLPTLPQRRLSSFFGPVCVVVPQLPAPEVFLGQLARCGRRSATSFYNELLGVRRMP
jgi:hypothetical protein